MELTRNSNDMNLKQIRKIIGICLLTGIGIVAAGCTGRTMENMEPAGETVRVVIPTQDVAEDAELANGEADAQQIEQPATPDRK